MSNWYEKIDYKCSCGQDYGTCKSPGTFYLKYMGVSDTYILFRRAHSDEKLELITYLDDDQMHAISALFSQNPYENGITGEEMEEINKTQKDGH